MEITVTIIIIIIITGLLFVYISLPLVKTKIAIISCNISHLATLFWDSFDWEETKGHVKVPLILAIRGIWSIMIDWSLWWGFIILVILHLSSNTNTHPHAPILVKLDVKAC